MMFGTLPILSRQQAKNLFLIKLKMIARSVAIAVFSIAAFTGCSPDSDAHIEKLSDRRRECDAAFRAADLNTQIEAILDEYSHAFTSAASFSTTSTDLELSIEPARLKLFSKTFSMTYSNVGEFSVAVTSAGNTWGFYLSPQRNESGLQVSTYTCYLGNGHDMVVAALAHTDGGGVFEVTTVDGLDIGVTRTPALTLRFHVNKEFEEKHITKGELLDIYSKLLPYPNVFTELIEPLDFGDLPKEIK